MELNIIGYRVEAYRDHMRYRSQLANREDIRDLLNKYPKDEETRYRPNLGAV